MTPTPPSEAAVSPSSSWTPLSEDHALLVRGYSTGPGNRTTTLVAGFGDGDLLVVSPGPDPSDECLAELEPQGRVRAILAPNGFHRAGLASWAARFPDATLHAAPAAAKRVAQVAPGVQDLEGLRVRLGGDLCLVEPPGLRSGEVWVSSPAEGGTLYAGDAFTNLSATSAFMAAFLWVLGFDGGLARNPWQRRMMATDRPAFDRWLRAEVERLRPGLLVPGHGDVVRGDDLTARLTALVPG